MWHTSNQVNTHTTSDENDGDDNQNDDVDNWDDNDYSW